MGPRMNPKLVALFSFVRTGWLANTDVHHRESCCFAHHSYELSVQEGEVFYALQMGPPNIVRAMALLAIKWQVICEDRLFGPSGHLLP